MSDSMAVEDPVQFLKQQCSLISSPLLLAAEQIEQYLFLTLMNKRRWVANPKITPTPELVL